MNEARGSDRFSLLIATPSHRGEVCWAYKRSVLDLQKYCLTNGIGFQLAMPEQISDIAMARNVLASLFLWRTSATHMLFIDDDMGFNVEELVKMFEWRGDDVVAAMCPRKRLNWERVKQIVVSNPDIESGLLPILAAEYGDMWRMPGDAGDVIISNKPMPVSSIGTGLMLVSRKCLLRIIEQAAGLPVIEQDSPTGGKVYEFFKTQIVNGHHLGEDFYFCNLVRRYGGQVLGCPWLTVNHIGRYSYIGSLKELARHGPKT